MEGERTSDALLDGDDGGMGRGSSLTATVVLSMVVASSGCFSYGFGSVYSSPAQSGIMADLGLSIAEYSVFGSILTVGGMVGALISGKLTDTIGRRHTMWATGIICLIGWLAIIFAKDAWWLYIGRLLTGVGFSIAVFGVTVYMAEITPKNVRGVCSAIVQVMVSFGASLVFFIGNFVMWRSLAVIGTVPCLIQIVGAFFIPESPRWLVKIGKEKEGEAALQRLRGKNVDVSLEAAEIKDYTLSTQGVSKSAVLDLFDKKYAYALTVGAGLMLLVQFGGISGITSYASSILQHAGASAAIGTTAMAIIQVPCSLLSAFLMDSCGRRPLLMVAGVGTCLGNLLMGLGLLLRNNQHGGLTSTVTMVGMLIYASSMYVGLSTPWIIMAEIFPINVKGPAGSLVTFINWSTSWIVCYAFNFLFEWIPAGVFFVFASICGLTVVFAITMVPETKGRTLEKIQEKIIIS